MNVRIQYHTSFAAGVSYEGQLIMNYYSVRLWLNTNTLDNENHNTAFERLKHFVNILENGIFVSVDDSTAIQNYLQAGIRVTTLPGMPVDQLIGIMLFYKLNAIMEDRISVLETEISSNLSEGITYMHCEQENIDIDIPPWWTTPDLVHCDTVPSDGENIVSLNKSTAWRDLDLAWPEDTDGAESATSDNTVVFANFAKDKDED